MNDITRDNCTIFPNKQHVYTFDATSSGTEKSVFCCVCGEELIEWEDAGTGA